MKLSAMLWCLFIHFFLFTSAFSRHEGNVTDGLSLLQFKGKVMDPLGVLNSWNDSQHFCEWQGITCGHRHRRVTQLKLDSSRLGGYLSPHIGNLSFMRGLQLQNNSFGHEIPEEIGRLFRLQRLYLHNNSFSGKIPINISGCSNLQYIALYNNHLSGKIPVGIGSLYGLKVLSLESNNLHGEIPTFIANLSNSLVYFNVEWNNFHGSIPNIFGQLKKLEEFAVGHNNLMGKIPPSICNHSSIRTFYVAMNRLQGNIPPTLFHGNLEEFVISGNLFSGQVPLISNASNLNIFQISKNYYTGNVPDFLSVPYLRSVIISNNNLGHGKDGDLNFMSSLVNCTKLELLSINDNNFGGVLPQCLSNFSTKLWRVTIGGNKIMGSIPIGIENLINLQLLGLEANKLVGPIPSSIGKLQKLFRLNFYDNMLSGAIPSSLGNLTSLGELILESNNLQGRLPSRLGECKKLQMLTLSKNNLTGSIPKEIIALSSLSQFLDLSRNFFTGSIPNEVGKLVNLGYMDISENRITGKVPTTFDSCESLQYLYLQGNLLKGSIPESFESLKGIEEIDLSRNNFSGKIPKYLESLHFLRKLNLSFNNFEGEIPSQGVFTNTSGFSIVGNTRLCGGIPSLNLLKCPLNTKPKTSGKQKLIVSVACGLVAIMLLTLFLVLLYRAFKRKGKSILGSPFGISFLEVSYGDLLKATDGFSSANLIGTGSFGSVYKGILNGGGRLEVAVKVLDLQISRALKSFTAECKVLKNIRHRNVVKIVTSCSSIDYQGNDFKALVYGFMINGSLEEWLHPSHGVNLEQARHLNLIQRINIAIDVANALDYLHHRFHVPIVHSDVKPSNILLDGDMTARVGDFGLARFLSDPSHLFSSYESSSVGVRGSIGYIAPEYVMGGELSREGDVYSYGILLLEMFTGKRPFDEMFKDDFNLHNFVKMSLSETIAQVVDSALLIRNSQVEERPTASEHGDIEIDRIEEININFHSLQNRHLMLNASLEKALHSVLKIGIACSEKTSTERMNMGDVIKELLHVKTAYMGAEIQEGRRPRTG